MPQFFSSMLPDQGMDYPEVDKRLIGELEGMGFSLARTVRALNCSSNISLEAAVNWIIDHENDPDIDEMPLVAMNIDIESPQPTHITEETQLSTQELRERARKRKYEEEKKSEWEIEKERIRSGNEFHGAKQIAEENERKRNLASRKAEKEEEKRARERIRQKLEADKAERRQMLGLSSKDPTPVKSSQVFFEKNNPSGAVDVMKTEQMRERLRSLRRNYKDNDYKVQRAFHTLLYFVGNVAKNPNEEKYRRIRVGNPLFQDRVVSLQGGVEFLELCGFERKGQFLYIPHESVDLAILNSAGCVLKSAITNPFFGLLSN